MKIGNKIRYEKLQYDTDSKKTKIRTFSLIKIDKYEYLADEEILPFNQRKMMHQAKFRYFLLLEKHLKNKQK